MAIRANRVGVNATIRKTEEMTQPVGIAADGKLYTKPGESGEQIPPHTAVDVDKVLTVGAEGLEWADIPEELPQEGATEGKVLIVGAAGLEWADIPKELPDHDAADAGKVLTVGADGNVAFQNRKLYDVKTSLDATVQPDTIYCLGERSVVSVALPAVSGNAGKIIDVIFYSGATATTLSITGQTIGEIITPEANTRVEINMLCDGVNWALVTNVLEVSA